jgi:hypothetical protein
MRLLRAVGNRLPAVLGQSAIFNADVQCGQSRMGARDPDPGSMRYKAKVPIQRQS